MITGAAAVWLRSRREELNHRFAAARRRFATLDPERVLHHVGQIIPPLAGDEPAADELCLTVYDLILLHVGRDTFSLRPGIGHLMREVFPRLRSLLLQSPRTLPGAMCNAVENLGVRGEKFADRLSSMEHSVTNPDNLLSAGALLAWRLGEARLRTSALQAARSLPPGIVLRILDLAEWPEASAPLALACLESDAWHPPQARISNPDASKGDELLRHLHSALVAPVEQWQPVHPVGDFAGFGGSFEAPPLILNGGDRYTLFARSRDSYFRIAADCYGWICRPCADPGFDVRVPQRTGGLFARLGLRFAKNDGTQLSSDGTLTTAGRSVRLDALQGATSLMVRPDLLAYTTENSCRVRILAPAGPAL